MKCEHVQDRLTGYLLGDLDEHVSAEIRRHLESCANCRAALQDTDQTLDVLRDALAAPSGAPERLSASHKAEVARAAPPSKRRCVDWITTRHPALAMAAGLLVLLGGFSLLIGHMGRSGPMKQASAPALHTEDPAGDMATRSAAALDRADDIADEEAEPAADANVRQARVKGTAQRLPEQEKILHRDTAAAEQTGKQKDRVIVSKETARRSRSRAKEPAHVALQPEAPMQEEARQQEGFGKPRTAGGRVVQGAVVRGLDWLEKEQSEDGSWNGDVEDTSLAVLALLAHGADLSSARYGDMLRQGLMYLAGVQREGWFSEDPETHAKATLAVTEALSSTPPSMLETAAREAIHILAKHELEQSRPSLWRTQALAAATRADFGVPDAASAWRNELRQFSASGKPASVAVMRGAGSDRAPEPAGKRETLGDTSFRATFRQDLETMYFMTLARFFTGGPEWVTWQRQASTALADARNRDGSFSSDGQAGDVVATSLALLIDQVYDRRLSTFQPAETLER